jgi:hypothetical protein
MIDSPSNTTKHMKRMILLFAVLALSAHALRAQRTLPPALAAYYHAYADVFRPLGFEPDAAVGRIAHAGDQRSSVPLTLDSILSFVEYPDSLPEFREVFTYPQANVEVDVQSVFEAGAWTTTGRTTQYADGLGRITELLIESVDSLSGEFVPSLRTLIYPRGDSPVDIDSIILLGWVPDLGEYEALFISRYYYDDLERIDEVVTTINFFGLVFNQLDYYSYDGEGRLVLIESFLMDEAVTIPNTRTEFTYDGSLLVSELTLVSDEVGGFDPDTRIDYDYTAEGLADTVVTYEWDAVAEDWREVSVLDTDYDAAGKITAETTVGTDEFGTVTRQRTEYDYLDEDNLARNSFYNWDDAGQAWLLAGRSYYYYAELTSIALPRDPVTPLALWPNPTSGRVRLETGDQSGAVWVYSLGGQLVDHQVLTAGNRELDLGRLPAGLYQVRLLSGERIYAGRVVVQ